MLAIDHLKSCKGGGGEVVDTCPINTWQWWLARAHSRRWVVRTMRFTLQMRQLAEVMGRNQSVLLVLSLAAEGWIGARLAGLGLGRAGAGVGKACAWSGTRTKARVARLDRHSTLDERHRPALPRASRNHHRRCEVELRFHSRTRFHSSSS